MIGLVLPAVPVWYHQKSMVKSPEKFQSWLGGAETYELPSSTREAPPNLL